MVSTNLLQNIQLNVIHNFEYCWILLNQYQQIYLHHKLKGDNMIIKNRYGGF